MKLKLINSKNYLYESFSTHWQQLQNLRVDDEEFSGICDDYESCMQIINENPPDDAQSQEHVLEHVKEYKELCSSLESEIAYYLKAGSMIARSSHHKLSK